MDRAGLRLDPLALLQPEPDKARRYRLAVSGPDRKRSDVLAPDPDPDPVMRRSRVHGGGDDEAGHRAPNPVVSASEIPESRSSVSASAALA